MNIDWYKSDCYLRSLYNISLKSFAINAYFKKRKKQFLILFKSSIFYRSILLNNTLYDQSKLIMESAENIHSHSVQEKPTPIEHHSTPNSQDGVTIIQLFRQSESLDYLLIVAGIICSIATGVSMPLFVYIWGQTTDTFMTEDELVHKSGENLINFVFLGITTLLLSLIMRKSWMITGKRQATKCRRKYLKSLLKQQIGWFDIKDEGKLTTKLLQDSQTIEDTISQQIPDLIMIFTNIISGFVLAFTRGWLMTLVIFALLPILAIASQITMTILTKKQKRKAESYIQAGSRAKQAMQLIKTVKQLNGQAFQSIQYKKLIETGRNKAHHILTSFGVTFLSFTMICCYSLSFWFGSKCITGSEGCTRTASGQSYTAGDIITIFMNILMGGYNLSGLTPCFQKIIEGRQVAQRVFSIIDRKPQIPDNEEGVIIETPKFVIKFQNVTFSYPKSPDKKILYKFNLETSVNKIGIIGSSGCGKSTVIQLIMRFYDPIEGRITIDGHNLKDLNLKWWRSQIGYVGQQPKIFCGSIKQNLLIGNPEASNEQLYQSLKQAQALEFVQKLPKNINTDIGQQGCQLSGGQKQRIAIARAIIRKPKVILLDQATSALDKRNQKMIIQTLDRISNGKRTVTISHRKQLLVHSQKIIQFEGSGQKMQTKEIKIRLQQNPEIDDELSQQKQDRRDQQLDQERAENKLQERYTNSQIFSRIFAYSMQKLPFLIVSFVFSILFGVVEPVNSIFLAKIISLLVMLSSGGDNSQQMQTIAFYSLVIFIIAGLALFIGIVQKTCFIIVGQHITQKLRFHTFNKILKMPIPWFEEKENDINNLSSKLLTDCRTVNSVTTLLICLIIENISTLASGLVIAFIFEWRTALVSIGLLPLIVISQLCYASYYSKIKLNRQETHKKTGIKIAQALSNIKTVQSLGYQNILIDEVEKEAEEQQKQSICLSFKSGLLFGFSRFTMFTVFGLLFYIGAIIIIKNKEIQPENIFTAIYVIMFAGTSIGKNINMMPDLISCKRSAANLFRILDSEDEDQIQKKQSSKLLASGINGEIVFQNVDFKYRSRKQYIFKGFSLKIKNGEKLCLVGYSGSGKSTILSLIQRFYEPQNGQIRIGGVNIRDFDLHYLRSQFGVVSQEPLLFKGSVSENIKYNKIDCSIDEIHKAAKLADYNIEQNTSYKQGVGERGQHISGGQKQRVAIARALLRKPKILLLDEATSALDDQRAKRLQILMNSNVLLGVTVVYITHRLKNSRNFDKVERISRGEEPHSYIN